MKTLMKNKSHELLTDGISYIVRNWLLGYNRDFKTLEDAFEFMGVGETEDEDEEDCYSDVNDWMDEEDWGF